MNFKKKVNGSWVDVPHYVSGTGTETITTLPATIYPLAQTATIGLKGNTVQSGTPTPDSPIMPSECGDRTENLLDKSTADLYSHSTLGQTNTWAYSVESTGTTLRIPCDANTQYTLSIGSTIGNTIFRISDISTDDVPIEGGSGGIVCHTILNGGAINNYTFTTASDSKYILFQVNANVMTAALNTLMLNTGSTPLPYEPWGIKIPISSASTTTPVYLGEVETERKIKKYEFTGNEEWIKGNYAPSGGYQFFTPKPSDIADNPDWLITHFKKGSGLNGSEFASYLSLYPETSILPENATANDFKAWLATQYAAGTPATIWYVLATPTTGIVNAPLRKIGTYADEVSGITIPTIAGADTLSVDTTLQPSEVTANYHGWHSVTDVHERENGAWT